MEEEGTAQVRKLALLFLLPYQPTNPAIADLGLSGVYPPVGSM
jgi:hypothetical protein